MSDEAAYPIHDVGMAMLANLDLRDDVPDEFEVDLRDADPGVTTIAGQCKGHVWFRFRAKIDRTVIGLVSHCLDEFRVLGDVDVAVDHVRCEPRDTQPLDTRRVDLRKLRDRRNLAQQTHGVDSTLL